MCSSFSESSSARDMAMAKHSVKRTILLLAPLILAGSFAIMAFAQDDASATIASARQQLITCYDSARQAEAAGANISSLTTVLNNAGNLLSRAELANSQGDYATAQSLASQCTQSLGNFASEAEALRSAAVQQGNLNFWVNIVGSVAGTVAVIIAGFVVWRVIKKRYGQVEVEAEVHADEPSGV